MILSGLSQVREYLENLEKSENFKVKIMWHPCFIKHCIEQAKNYRVKINFCREAHNIFGPRA